MADAIVVSVRPAARARGRCGQCRRRSPRYDAGEGRRRWRALDLGTTRVFLEARAPRVQCREHGVIVAAVPWARHRAGHTRDFDDLAAWLAVRTSKSAVMELLRVAWRTVGSIVTRVNADIDKSIDRLEPATDRDRRDLLQTRAPLPHRRRRPRPRPPGVGRPRPQRRRPQR